MSCNNNKPIKIGSCDVLKWKCPLPYCGSNISLKIPNFANQTVNVRLQNFKGHKYIYTGTFDAFGIINIDKSLFPTGVFSPYSGIWKVTFGDCTQCDPIEFTYYDENGLPKKYKELHISFEFAEFVGPSCIGCTIETLCADIEYLNTLVTEYHTLNTWFCDINETIMTSDCFDIDFTTVGTSPGGQCVDVVQIKLNTEAGLLAYKIAYNSLIPEYVISDIIIDNADYLAITWNGVSFSYVPGVAKFEGCN